MKYTTMILALLGITLTTQVALCTFSPRVKILLELPKKKKTSSIQQEKKSTRTTENLLRVNTLLDRFTHNIKQKSDTIFLSKL